MCKEVVVAYLKAGLLLWHLSVGTEKTDKRYPPG
jgi:hypothetical protein